MTSINAMKLALAALETCRIRSVSEWSVEDITPKNVTAAIAALRTAIQQAEAQQPATGEPVGYMNEGHIHELAMRRIPYGYVYPEAGAGASTAVYTHPEPSEPDVDFELQELREIERAMDDFADCGDTDVVDTLLLRAVQAGFLECTHFHVANRGALQEAIDAAMLAAK